MKKIFLPLAIGLIPMLAILNGAHAQESKDSIKDSIIYAKNESPLTATGTAVNSTAAANSTADIKTISKKAIKNFAAEFRKADDVKWFKLTDGFMAYCTVNGNHNRSSYDKKGNWLYSMQYYGEKKLPVDVRAMVKRTYYDFSISGVQEIHVENKIVYLVYMNDENTYKTVRVCDDEMEVIDSFPKQH